MKIGSFWKSLFVCVCASTCLGAKEVGTIRTATFAGGCFWCVQSEFDKLKGHGVVKTVVGYTGGKFKNPTYEHVSGGNTGHVEAIQVTYDPNQISYEKLLDIYWHNIDPTQKNGQFCDEGPQYRTIIFYQNKSQKSAVENSKKELVKSGQVPIVYTEILPAKTFYPAEEYHQEYYKKNSFKYKMYHSSCGRSKKLKEVWGNK